MKLLIDIGNSCLKWAVLDKPLTITDALPQARIHYHQSPPLAEQFNAAWGNLPYPTGGVWISSVAAPQLLIDIQQWTQQQWQLIPHRVQSSTFAAGVYNSYAQPERLGVDRWLAMIGAYQQFKTACCIVDCGTAVTIDVIDTHGQHQGGLISTGLTKMLRALTHETAELGQYGAHLNPVAALSPMPLLANHSQAAMQRGIAYSVVGMIHYVLNNLATIPNLMQGGNASPVSCAPSIPITLVMTGGDAAVLLPLLQYSYHYIPDLVLRGLAYLSAEGA